MRCGLSHGEFWELTPTEVILIIRAYGRRLRDQLELGIAASWYGASFERTERLPDLAKVLRKTSHAERSIDKVYTQRETRRWAALLAGQGKPS